jgi:hypothetical protein
MTKPLPGERKDLVLDPNDSKLLEAELAEAQKWLQRFGNIWFEAKRVADPPLLVSRAGAGSVLRIDQHDGGKGAQYFFISRKEQKHAFFDRPLPVFPPPRETIAFLPQVAGTDILYDLTDEMLQGKCRPFVCDVTTVRCRVYALLPVQIEAIALTAGVAPAGSTAQVEFHDARGQRLQAVFPFHFRIEADGNEIKSGYYVTEVDGRFDFSKTKLLTDLPPGATLTVRSQLTGREKSCSLG